MWTSDELARLAGAAHAQRIGQKARHAGGAGPHRVAVKAYAAAGTDLLLCLANPYKIPHDEVMQTIDLMGKDVIPEFQRPRAPTPG